MLFVIWKGDNSVTCTSPKICLHSTISPLKHPTIFKNPKKNSVEEHFSSTFFHKIFCSQSSIIFRECEVSCKNFTEAFFYYYYPGPLEPEPEVLIPIQPDPKLIQSDKDKTDKEVPAPKTEVSQPNVKLVNQTENTTEKTQNKTVSKVEISQVGSYRISRLIAFYNGFFLYISLPKVFVSREIFTVHVFHCS